jgi:hypothetical protein
LQRMNAAGVSFAKAADLDGHDLLVLIF